MLATYLLATLVGAVVLFLWSGLTQAFPWGVPRTQTLSTQSPSGVEAFQAPNLVQLPPGALTSDAFDERMADRVSTLTTDRTFAWIVAKPIGYYRPAAYFAREAATQLVVAALLAALLLLLPNAPLATRLALVALAGSAAVAGTYGTQMNWWGLPPSYGVGVGFNLVAGWLLATAILSLWPLRSAGA
jgi:hypothetical protein